MSSNKNKLSFVLPVAVFILTMAFIYLLLAFTLWNLNAAQWSVGARAMYGIWGTGFSIITALGVSMYSNDR